MAYRVTYRNSFSLGPIGFLIITNTILYVATSINPNFISLFGLQPASFLMRPWTIITNLFVHAPLPSIGHILFNMFLLWFYGTHLIQLIGEKKFSVVYFAGGILGNILYLGLAPPFTIAIGASGAVFAVGGALTALRPNLRVFIFPIPVPIPLWVAVIGGFFLMTSPGIAWEAHLGGLVFGLAAGYFLRRPGNLWRRRSRSVYWRGKEIWY